MKNLLLYATLTCGLILSFITQGQIPNRFDIVIDELFPDPSPVIGLPAYEFIELKNISRSPVNLKGWKLTDGTSTATINVNYIIQPDSFLIVCSNTAVSSFSSLGPVLGVTSFPSLNNDADNIILYAPNGAVIHAVSYNMQWYHNDVKSEGGWTLEMIDPHNPCGGLNNWTSSTDNSGGTPGRKNAVDAENPDQQPPALLRTYSLNDTTVIAVFEEPIDSASAAVTAHYSIDNGLGAPKWVRPQAPFFTEVQLILSSSLQNQKVYTLTVSDITDCANNTIGQLHKARAALTAPSDSTMIVINEILFDPIRDGYDYIELYNKSNHTVDLNQLYLCNRSSSGALSNIKQLAATPYLFFPGEHLAFTTNKRWVLQNYVAKYPENIIEVTQLPSFPDDKGIAVLTNQKGDILDELQYDSKWHFGLLSNKEGVALERINYHSPTQNKNNWTSAASTARYGTPGYANSQLRVSNIAMGTFNITPKIFSPDNDGYEDQITINYNFSSGGNVANINVYDVQGRVVRALAKSALLGTSGYFRWDGLDEKLNKLPVGAYIIVSEIFNQDGKKQLFKNTVTLARKI